MISMKALVVSAVGAGCLAAAGLGGYLAVPAGPVESAAAPTSASIPPSATITDVKIEPGAMPATPASPAAVAPAPPVTARPAVVPRPSLPTPPASVRADRSSDRTPTTPVAGPRPAPSEHAAAEPVVSTPTDPEPTRTAGPVDEIQIPSPETPRVTFQELTVGANGVIGIRLETPVSSETAKVEDRVTARVLRDVTVDGRVAVPAGSTFEGVVTEVERGGRFRERARLGVRFTSVVLADNTRVSVSTEPIYRMGEAPTGEATSKIGAATAVGAIIGAAIGGKKGAAIGGATGAAGGTAAVMASGPNHVVLTAGTSLTVRLTEPATFQVPLER
jgi:hypothetical protein